MAGEFPAPKDVLPHTDPILWVDEVVAMDDDSINALWTPKFEGEFDPMTLIEALTQAGAYKLFLNDKEPRLPLFGEIQKASFGRMPKPGEVVELETKMAGGDGKKFLGEAVAWVGGEMACSTTVGGVVLAERSTLMLMRRDELVDGRADVVDQDGCFEAPDRVLGKDKANIALDLVTDFRRNLICGSWLAEQPWYDGHEFGGQYVLPGIRQVGSLRDLALYHLAMIRTKADMSRIRFSGLENVGFTRPVRPTERMVLEAVHGVESDRMNQTYSGVARVAGKAATTATMFFEMAA